MNKYIKALAVAGLVASVSAGASAAEGNAIKLELGGHMEQWVGTSDQADVNENHQSSDVQSDSEISVKGETTLRNGLKVGAEVQIEGDTNGIDDSFAYVEGNFGRVAIGSLANAVVTGHVTSTDVGLGINAYRDGGVSHYNWVPSSNTTTTEASTFASLDNSDKKVVYTSPRVAGLQLGASWAPDVSDANAVEDTNGTTRTSNDAYAASLNYEKELGNINLAASLGYQTISNPSDDIEAKNIGLNVGFNGFTVGTSYAISEFDSSAVAEDTTSLDFGVSYETGPLTVSANYLENVTENATGTGDEEEETLAVAAAYELGAGVEVVGTIGTVEFEDNDGVSTNDNSGEFFVVGTRFTF